MSCGIIVSITFYFFLNKDTKGLFLLNWILIPIIIGILITLGIKGFERKFRNFQHSEYTELGGLRQFFMQVITKWG